MTERSPQSAERRDEGAAVIAAMFVLVLMAALAAGITTILITDTKVRSLDGTRTQAFYAAHAGLEQLTASLGDLFLVNVAPTAAQVNALAVTPPAGLNATWLMPDGTDGYLISFPVDGQGRPAAEVTTVNSGPFQGLVGLATPYQMMVTARIPDRSEATLTRTLQTMAIPVFQFGIFSENDLSFFAGPNFNFGGRVHTNSSLFLAEGNGNTLTLADRVTSANEIIRTNLSNGWDTNTNYTGTVRAITAPGAFRNLARTEGSLIGTVGSAINEPLWFNLSTGNYNYNITNRRTGARRLDLPISTFGAGPIDLIKRPLPNENVANPALLGERFFTLASVRIFLSDTAAEITNMPGVTGTAPVELGLVTPYAVSQVPPRPRFARSTGAATQGARINNDGTPLLGGFLKVEKQTAAGVWVDVTQEILQLGINSPQLWNDTPGGAVCADHTPNAILRLQKLWDAGGAGANGCWTLAEAMVDTATGARRYVPHALYDPREGLLRDTADASMHFSGIMHYIEIDVRNLSRWLTGALPGGACLPACTGADTMNVNGFTVYFSDRRGNKNGANETGEFGFEDIVNPASGTGAPNGVLNVGEDFNNSTTLQVYGATSRLPYGVGAWATMLAPLTAARVPNDMIDPGAAMGAAEEIAIARRNPPIFFRRALKLSNGALGNIVAPGLTVVSENPVYIQGNWNANAAGFGNPHVATAVIADSVTLLSNNWNDRNSFTNPHVHSANQRNAVTTWYRVAIISGKGLSFPQPAGTPQDYGTDGGAHNFLRYIENWANQTLNYRGSIASLYISRQGNGTYKCCTTVYSPPTRGYNFDVEFLTPALLPPRTPMFRDVNLTGFQQIIRPR